MANDWDELFDSVQILGDLNSEELPTDEELDEYERRTSFRLPHGYREFIKRFGPGEVGGAFFVTAPGYGDNPDVDIDAIARECLEIKDAGFAARWFDDPPRARRMVFFAGELETGMVLGWDPEQVTSQDPREYAIYYVPRNYHGPYHIAENFYEFADGVAFGFHYYTLNVPSDELDQAIEECRETFGDPRTFKPRERGWDPQ